MSRPLLITDCDEVLLHMVVPFRAWLDEAHGIHFDFAQTGFVNALRRKACGSEVEEAEVWTLLRAFFESEMHQQTPIAGALEALDRIARFADIVVLTNISEQDHERRIAQLRHFGLTHPVFWNQGPKGAPLSRIVAQYQPSATVFVDDLGLHHSSVHAEAPAVWRLHMVGEPELAPHIPPASHAHQRLDRWSQAEQWISERLREGKGADTAPLIETGGPA